jgi:hypothetical protein
MCISSFLNIDYRATVSHIIVKEIIKYMMEKGIDLLIILFLLRDKL